MGSCYCSIHKVFWTKQYPLKLNSQQSKAFTVFKITYLCYYTSFSHTLQTTYDIALMSRSQYCITISQQHPIFTVHRLVHKHPTAFQGIGHSALTQDSALLNYSVESGTKTRNSMPQWFHFKDLLVAFIPSMRLLNPLPVCTPNAAVRAHISTTQISNTSPYAYWGTLCCRSSRQCSSQSRWSIHKKLSLLILTIPVVHPSMDWHTTISLVNMHLSLQISIHVLSTTKIPTLITNAGPLSSISLPWFQFTHHMIK